MSRVDRREADCAGPPIVRQWPRHQGVPSVTESPSVIDVVVAGGAASGMALAAAIKQALGDGVAVAVVDPAPPAQALRPPLRTVAIAEGPRRLLDRIGAWEEIAPKTQAIVKMAITDGRVRDAVRLPHL